MRSRKKKGKQPEPFLFELPPAKEPEPLVKVIQYPIWTENKAKLIERYLYYFVMITKHGCYIDGFAGPQAPNNPDTWAAKLVLENEPKWLRNFHLFESDESKFNLLEELKRTHSNNSGPVQRDVQVYCGDFNEEIKKVLSSGCIGQKEATFCLLDQRTFECHWNSLEALAGYKRERNKIELFYFLANAWLNRSFAAQQNMDVLKAWWGKDDWTILRDCNTRRRAEIVCTRMKEELGYKSAKPWPIYEREDSGGRIMYFMIHATDHPHAPLLMRRAYDRAVGPKESIEQLEIEFGQLPLGS